MSTKTGGSSKSLNEFLYSFLRTTKRYIAMTPKDKSAQLVQSMLIVCTLHTPYRKSALRCAIGCALATAEQMFNDINIGDKQLWFQVVNILREEAKGLEELGKEEMLLNNIISSHPERKGLLQKLDEHDEKLKQYQDLQHPFRSGFLKAVDIVKQWAQENYPI